MDVGCGEPDRGLSMIIMLTVVLRRVGLAVF